MRFRNVLIGVLLYVLMAGTSVWAQCSVSASTVDFGTYDTLSPTPLDTTGTITIGCSRNALVIVTIGPSNNSGGFNPRSMKHTSLPDLLDYNLYTNSNRTRIWGNGTGGTIFRIAWVRRNRATSLTVYGRIPPGQNVSVGTYNDTLVVTVIW